MHESSGTFFSSKLIMIYNKKYSSGQYCLKEWINQCLSSKPCRRIIQLKLIHSATLLRSTCISINAIYLNIVYTINKLLEPITSLKMYTYFLEHIMKYCTGYVMNDWMIEVILAIVSRLSSATEMQSANSHDLSSMVWFLCTHGRTFLLEHIPSLARIQSCTF